jgi:hypothetical protein
MKLAFVSTCCEAQHEGVSIKIAVFWDATKLGGLY